MSRLYYDPPTNVSQDLSGKDKHKEYLSKVFKLIPSEIIMGFITIMGFVPLIEIIPKDKLFWIYQGLVIVFITLTVLFLVSQADKKRPKIVHTILSVIAFIIWTYAIYGHVIWPKLYDGAIASIILVLFSLLSGLIPLKKIGKEKTQ